VLDVVGQINRTTGTSKREFIAEGYPPQGWRQWWGRLDKATLTLNISAMRNLLLLVLVGCQAAIVGTVNKNNANMAKLSVGMTKANKAMRVGFIPHLLHHHRPLAMLNGGRH
jgi:hypothetical protein